MINSASTVSQQFGAVFCWTLTVNTEMDFDWVSQQVGVEEQNHGTVRLTISNYYGDWINSHYDKPNKTAVQLKVLSVERNRYGFSYVGMRTAGSSFLDKAAARNKEPEWYKIHVKHTPASAQNKKEVITATWERIQRPE
jgi:hypothetical protein